MANLSGGSDAPPGTIVQCNNYHGLYCYEAGAVGPFTPLQLITMAFWVGPLLLACTIVTLRLFLGKSNTSSETNGAVPAASSVPPSSSWLMPVWISLNLLWFLLPLFSYGLGLHEIEPPMTRNILAIALAASHPLSWNLALVVIPTGRDDGVVSKLLVHPGNQSQWFQFHRLLGYTTAFWGVLHGFSEIIYLMTSAERFRSFWAITTNGETLLYWFGFMALVLLLAQASVAYSRRRWPNSFRKMHTMLAVALLLVATAHWWPFAFFFCPATAIHAVTITNRYLAAIPPKYPAVFLGVSLIASCLGLWLGWTWRQSYMLSEIANLYLVFVFPPLSVALALAASLAGTAGLALAVTDRTEDAGRRVVVPTVTTPLLTTTTEDVEATAAEDSAA